MVTPPEPPSEGIVGSGNNINIQVQQNSGYNVEGQTGEGGTFTDLRVIHIEDKRCYTASL
jgi:hypothetical protein